ncbi:MAG: 2-amino-4-hydroxy-6-hydroxymethyldihydropteridine diphosphokinase [Chloroflexi bacterium]|nr:2-amino-4-hydroxy-6-hydroxymethyldihydropteridine diphosphokinase [Chloroflexota bacterium]
MSQAWERAYLGLGSNLGDRAANLAAAVERLVATPGLRVLRCSSLYETEPVGYLDQPWFLNAVVEVETSLEPAALLQRARAIEAELGRQPGPRWGPRPIDVDILLYGQRTVLTPALQVPHPELWNRLFVLLPLAELQPQLTTPAGQPIAERIAELRQSQMVSGESSQLAPRSPTL